MEADWSVEIGPDLPVIEADWEGYVDLCSDPGNAASLPEVAELPALAAALRMLNGPGSPLLTSKCDVWPLDPAEIDPDEFGAVRGACSVGLGLYVDVVLKDRQWFASFEAHEAWARAAVALLREKAVPNGRTDLVIRAAEQRGMGGFGLTLYAAGCGADAAQARVATGAVLAAAAVTMLETTPPRARSSIG